MSGGLSIFNPEDFEENNQELLGLTITSNCNNELGYIPTPPACKECVKLTCKPLDDIGIQLEKINKIQNPKLLGTGGMNKVYDISYPIDSENEKKLALRLTTTNDKITTMKESVGLLYQTKLSKSKEEGGLGCEYIAKVHDFGKYENLSGNYKINRQGVYGILEKLPMDLFERATTEGNIFTENDLKSMTKQVLMALSCMHQNNIYHFDIKPENIMMCDDGNENVKLIDFGLCYTYDRKDPTEEVLTRRGSPDYFSPGFIFRSNPTIYNTIDNIPYPIDDLWALAVTICLISIPNILKIFPGNDTKMYIFNKDYEKWSKMPESIRFCKRIFDTVDGGTMRPNESFTTLTAADLLKDPWFQEVKGGKSKRKRKNKRKNKRKTKRGKSKRKRKN